MFGGFTADFNGGCGNWADFRRTITTARPPAFPERPPSFTTIYDILMSFCVIEQPAAAGTTIDGTLNPVDFKAAAAGQPPTLSTADCGTLRNIPHSIA
jgi:hypothetical protein